MAFGKSVVIAALFCSLALLFVVRADESSVQNDQNAQNNQGYGPPPPPPPPKGKFCIAEGIRGKCVKKTNCKGAVQIFYGPCKKGYACCVPAPPTCKKYKGKCVQKKKCPVGYSAIKKGTCKKGVCCERSREPCKKQGYYDGLCMSNKDAKIQCKGGKQRLQGAGCGVGICCAAVQKRYECKPNPPTPTFQRSPVRTPNVRPPTPVKPPTVVRTPVRTPTSKTNPPTVVRTPTVEHRTPTVDHRTPTVDQRTPTVDQRTPTVDQRTPTVDQRTPTVEVRTPHGKAPSPRKIPTPTPDCYPYCEPWNTAPDPPRTPQPPGPEPFVTASQSVPESYDYYTQVIVKAPPTGGSASGGDNRQTTSQNIVMKPRPASCNTLNATDCQSCLEFSTRALLRCGWCSSATAGTVEALNQGSCAAVDNCPAASANVLECTVTTIKVPPCPKNCSGHGVCAHKTTTVPADAPVDTKPNVTAVCVCEPGFSGDTCTTTPSSIVAVGALSSGAIIGIVLAVVAVVALVGGGGAYAYSKAMNGGPVTSTSNNPLYRAMGTSGDNPIARY